jgi:hypothetical protein
MSFPGSGDLALGFLSDIYEQFDYQLYPHLDPSVPAKI